MSVKMDYTAASSLIGVLFEPLAEAFGGSVDCTYIKGSFCTGFCELAGEESVLCQALAVEGNDKVKCLM